MLKLTCMSYENFQNFLQSNTETFHCNIIVLKFGSYFKEAICGAALRSILKMSFVANENSMEVPITAEYM